jgi:hypothetical protein
VICSLLSLNVGNPLLTFQNGVYMLGNVTQGFERGREIATGFWLGNVNEEQLGNTRIILK